LIVVTHHAVAIIVARRAIAVVGCCRCQSSLSSPAAINLIVVFVRRHRRCHRHRIQSSYPIKSRAIAHCAVAIAIVACSTLKLMYR
jgi:hypothetical protein